MSLTDQTIAELVHGIRQMVDTNHQILQALRSAMPQWYGLDELMTRWDMGRDSVKDLLRQHTDYRGLPGVALTLHIDEVLHLDGVVKRQREARQGRAA